MDEEFSADGLPASEAEAAAGSTRPKECCFECSL